MGQEDRIIFAIVCICVFQRRKVNVLQNTLATFHQAQSNTDLVENEQGHADVQQESTGHTFRVVVVCSAEKSSCANRWTGFLKGLLLRDRSRWPRTSAAPDAQLQPSMCSMPAQLSESGGAPRIVFCLWRKEACLTVGRGRYGARNALMPLQLSPCSWNKLYARNASSGRPTG